MTQEQTDELTARQTFVACCEIYYDTMTANNKRGWDRTSSVQVLDFCVSTGAISYEEWHEVHDWCRKDINRTTDILRKHKLWNT